MTTANTDIFQIGNDVTTGGDSPEDCPNIGDRRPIRDAASGLHRAFYEVTAVEPPRIDGGLHLIHGRIVEVMW